MNEESDADPQFPHSHATQRIGLYSDRRASMEDERMEQQNPDAEPELFIPEAGQDAEEEDIKASAYPATTQNGSEKSKTRRLLPSAYWVSI